LTPAALVRSISDNYVVARANVEQHEDADRGATVMKHPFVTAPAIRQVKALGHLSYRRLSAARRVIERAIARALKTSYAATWRWAWPSAGVKA
jgi:hypothetical protein